MLMFLCIQVVMSRRDTMQTNCPPMCTLEISDYGILMLDKSKEGVSSNLANEFKEHKTKI